MDKELMAEILARAEHCPTRSGEDVRYLAVKLRDALEAEMGWRAAVRAQAADTALVEKGRREAMAERDQLRLDVGARDARIAEQRREIARLHAEVERLKAEAKP